MKKLFIGSPIKIIQNSINSEAVISPSFPQKREKIILFIGRLDPKKGVDLLIRAFIAAGGNTGWQLAIAGPTWSDSYIAHLKELAAAAPLDSIRFLGPIFGDEKQEWLQRAWVLAVPSHSEAVGLVNLEAAIHLLPTITTHETGLYDWEEGGGLLIHPNEQELTLALKAAISWTESERESRAWMSKALVERRYCWDSVEEQWASLYQSFFNT